MSRVCCVASQRSAAGMFGDVQYQRIGAAWSSMTNRAAVTMATFRRLATAIAMSIDMPKYAMFAQRAGTRMARKPGTWLKRKRWKNVYVPKEPATPRMSHTRAIASVRRSWRAATMPAIERTIDNIPGKRHRSASTLVSAKRA